MKYDKGYLNDLLIVIASNLAELEDWSIHNNDEKLDEINQLRGLFHLLKKQLLK